MLAVQLRSLGEILNFKRRNVMDHCEEKRRLAEQFTLAAEAYANAARKFRDTINGGNPTAPDADIGETRSECAKARRALHAHIVKHRC